MLLAQYATLGIVRAPCISRQQASKVNSLWFLGVLCTCLLSDDEQQFLAQMLVCCGEGELGKEAMRAQLQGAEEAPGVGVDITKVAEVGLAGVGPAGGGPAGEAEVTIGK